VRATIPTTRAFLLTSTGELVRATVELTPPEPGWVLVRVRAAGVCGTDLAEHRRRTARPGAHPDVRIGHEVTGRVILDPTGRWAAETPVVVDPAVFCGACEPCRRGRTNHCPRLRLLGHDLGGGLADHLVVPASSLLEVPASLDPVVAALVEPLSCARHATTRVIGAGAADRVLVFGGGMIGVGVALLLRTAGHERITVVEPAAARRAVAAGLGLSVLAGPTATQAEVVVEASGNAVAFQDALRAVTRGGQLIVAAAHADPLVIDPDLAFGKEIRLAWSLGALREDFRVVLDLLAGGGLDPAPLAQVVRPGEFTTDTFLAMAAGTMGKPVVVWD
jgi:2-desacetyl-2-hydroxyethyl bacteriochlorophyllide A dehydrogenase